MITLQIKTHEGEIFNIEVSEYNPQEVYANLNDGAVNVILLGGQIFSRFDIKRIISDETLTNV